MSNTTIIMHSYFEVNAIDSNITVDITIISDYISDHLVTVMKVAIKHDMLYLVHML